MKLLFLILLLFQLYDSTFGACTCRSLSFGCTMGEYRHRDCYSGGTRRAYCCDRKCQYKTPKYTCGTSKGCFQLKFREVLTPVGQRTKGCSNQRIETNTPCSNGCQDCGISEWSAWSECNAECGLGLKSRARTISHQHQGAGTRCPSNLSETSPCTGVLCPDACKLSEWSGWNTCSIDPLKSKNCGQAGIQQRQRTVVAKEVNGGTCDFDLAESQDCDLGPCLTLPTTSSIQSESSSTAEDLDEFEISFPNDLTEKTTKQSLFSFGKVQPGNDSLSLSFGTNSIGIEKANTNNNGLLKSPNSLTFHFNERLILSFLKLKDFDENDKGKLTCWNEGDFSRKRFVVEFDILSNETFFYEETSFAFEYYSIQAVENSSEFGIASMKIVKPKVLSTLSEEFSETSISDDSKSLSSTISTTLPLIEINENNKTPGSQSNLIIIIVVCSVTVLLLLLAVLACVLMKNKKKKSARTYDDPLAPALQYGTLNIGEKSDEYDSTGRGHENNYDTVPQPNMYETFDAPLDDDYQPPIVYETLPSK